MRLSALSLTTALALAFSGQGLAADVFSGDGLVFSGVAAEDGQGLILPQTLVAGGRFNFGTQFETELVGPVALVAVEIGGIEDSGLGVFPVAPDIDSGFEARLTTGDIAWGLTPYVGIGLQSGTADQGPVFQGMAQLLPYEAAGVSVQGVAGIAYELMPGLGAGIEYRYHSYTASTPVAGDGADNQTIMMRLDLGLN